MNTSADASAVAPRVLITGASRGVGSYLAQGFLAAGYDLAVTSTSGRGFDDLLGCADELGRRVIVGALDVRDIQAVEAFLRHVVAQLGGLDVAINNAGVIETERVLWEADPSQWWNVLEVNVRGAFNVCHTVAGYFVEHGGGRIINLNSGSGGSDSVDLSAYHASKSALARVTSAVALAGRQHGVYAFDMAPGVVRTDMTSSMRMHDDRTEWTSPSEVVQLALALASGELDAYSGRMVRAGADAPVALKERAGRGLDVDARRLRWRSYGSEDPVVR